MNDTINLNETNSLLEPTTASSIKTGITAVICGLVIILSLLGNSLVIFIILRYKRLQNATNYILLSLAIADLTVSILVMIPSMIYDISNTWTFGALFCKFYNSFDITCCTASILHLLLVAIDRYVAIFKPLSYRNMVRKIHVFVIVSFVWLLSACISFIPIFSGLNLIHHENITIENDQNNDTDGKCNIEANLPYAIVSSSLSFWIPLILMIIVYVKIFVVARKQAQAIEKTDYHYYYNNHRKSEELQLNSLNNNNNNTLLNNKSYSCSNIENNVVASERLLQNKQKRKRRTNDTKAIKTLGIIMGIFIVCWLPFFVMYIYVAACPNCGLNSIAERLITWIGYVNSFINPIVYALTYRDFRKAYIQTLNSIAKLICPCFIKLDKKRKRLILGNMAPMLPTLNQNNSKTTDIIDINNNSCCSCCYSNKASSKHVNNQQTIKNGHNGINNETIESIKQGEIIIPV